MALDLERMMILMQRRYNIIREIQRLTEELAETFLRNDRVSAAMLLQMRGEEIEKLDACIREIWEMAEGGGDEAAQVRRLMNTDPSREASPESPEEKTIYEIRRKTKEALEKIQSADRVMSGRVVGEKSFYSKQKS